MFLFNVVYVGCWLGNMKLALIKPELIDPPKKNHPPETECDMKINYLWKRRTIIPLYLKPTRYKTIIRRRRARPKTWKSKHDTKKNINFEIGNGLKKVDVLGVWNAGKGHNNTIKVNMKNATNPRKKWDTTVEQILNPLRPISQFTHGLGNDYHQLLGCLPWRQVKRCRISLN